MVASCFWARIPIICHSTAPLHSSNNSYLLYGYSIAPLLFPFILIAPPSCSDRCGWLWSEWRYVSEALFWTDWPCWRCGLIIACHIMFPLWLFVNNGIRSHSCVSSVPTCMGTRSVGCLELLFKNLICLEVAFWRPEVIIVISDFGRAWGERRGKEHKRCRSLIFYLVGFCYYRNNRKTSTTNKRTVIWYQFCTLCSKSKLRNGTKVGTTVPVQATN
jgi:hypothetical protein